MHVWDSLFTANLINAPVVNFAPQKLNQIAVLAVVQPQVNICAHTDMARQKYMTMYRARHAPCDFAH